MTFPAVVVSVGTDHHPFDRLIEWIDRWAQDHADVDVFVQHGWSRAPVHVQAAPLVPHEQLQRKLRAATVAVTHGGPATIMDARDAGHLPLVVPRDPALGEHVDDHQQRFARRLSEVGDVRLIEDEGSLAAELDRQLADPTSARAQADDGHRQDAVARIAAIVEDLEREHAGRRRASSLRTRPLSRAPHRPGP